jgi:uncharacterized protein with HEPN domain
MTKRELSEFLQDILDAIADISGLYMTKRELSEFLQDILDAIADIEALTDGIDFETFRVNREKILAVVNLGKI